jgi:superfamily I DNA and/or RNA helicase
MMPSSLFYYDKLESIEKNDTPIWAQHLRSVEALSEPARGLAVLWNRLSQNTLAKNGWTAADPSTVAVRRQETWPVHFRGVVGHDASVTIETFAGSGSFSNRAEALAVVEIVSTLVTEKVATSSIGIMSPFRGQVVLIRKMLREKGLNGVDVGTVENYQAAERDVVVLSLTRSSEKFIPHDAAGRTGVFNQPKRTNVALTRAENLFIVVGNPNLMVKDSIWKQWLWFCLRNGLWYGDTIDEAVLEKMQDEYHPLLGADDNKDNMVLISALEQSHRTS